jgi:uncharacterized protein with PQ loop repeat
MLHEYLMNTASVFFLAYYIPELYANWKNKNANIYNMPEKVILVLASGFAFSYAMINNDIALISNYGPMLGLDIIAFLMRSYYVYQNCGNKRTTLVPIDPSDPSDPHTTDFP